MRGIKELSAFLTLQVVFDRFVKPPFTNSGIMVKGVFWIQSTLTLSIRLTQSIRKQISSADPAPGSRVLQ
jgi:hypothetical protein